MPIGDGTDATAGGMSVVLGTALRNTVHTLITATRDYIANGPAYWKSGVTVPLSKGGHGATTAAAARTNLGIELGTADAATANKVPVYNASGQLTTVDPTLGGHAASKQYVDALTAGKVSAGADVTFGQIYTPSSYAAVSGYTIAYINSDGRISKGASSERYKKYIRQVDPSELGDIFPDLHRFQMRSLDGTGDGRWILGWIAERLAESADLERFVVYDHEGRPDSIDFIQLLAAQTAQLHQIVTAQGALIERLIGEAGEPL